MRAPRGTAYKTFTELQAQDTDECVLWPYAHNGSMYGVVQHNGERAYVHRLSCSMAHGMPNDLRSEVAHSCHTPACFNPRHLRWATSAENHEDRVAAGHSGRGEAHSMAKLSEFDVRAIRHYVGCGTKQKVLVDHYGVSPMCVSMIVTGRRWGWLT